ncbi:hypothetical protein [Glutamicibacter sp.]|uniref:hypothetical protein n=1 Tax=Glutamicibacter sp. TaxID=1931995 RepID=UPI0028BE41A9|nr:hypothetical protein [Glutamicibacter sp.]
MAADKPTGNSSASQSELRSISWWAAVALGLLVGPTMTWIRTQRYFFFAGAAILAVVIIVIGVYTIRRRAKHPELARARTDATYIFWMIVLLVLVGPVQLVYVATDLNGLTIKSLILSAGLIVGIHEVDRALIKATKANTEISK